jgi:hypothetical protein
MKKVSELANDLKGFDIHRGAAVFLASAFKAHVAEDKYDKVAETPTFKRLQQLPPGKKAAVDAAFHGLSAACEQLLGENTFLGKVIKEIAEDTGPELSKRLNNGAEARPATAAGQRFNVSPAKEKMRLTDILAGLEESDLESFLNWIDTTTPEERANTLKNISNFSPEKILGIAKLKPENRERLLSLSEEPKVEKPKGPGIVREFLSPFRRELIERAKKRRGGSNEQ